MSAMACKRGGIQHVEWCMCLTKVGGVQRPKHATQGSCEIQRAKGFASIAGLHCRCASSRINRFCLEKFSKTEDSLKTQHSTNSQPNFNNCSL